MRRASTRSTPGSSASRGPWPCSREGRTTVTLAAYRVVSSMTTRSARGVSPHTTIRVGSASGSGSVWGCTRSWYGPDQHDYLARLLVVLGPVRRATPPVRRPEHCRQVPAEPAGSPVLSVAPRRPRRLRRGGHGPRAAGRLVGGR